MNCREKWLNLLTICRKAGRLAMGFDPAREEILAGRAAVVFVAGDASHRTKKEVRFFCNRENIPVKDINMITMDDIANAAGRRAGVIAVCDKGFAKRLTELSEDIN